MTSRSIKHTLTLFLLLILCLTPLSAARAQDGEPALIGVFEDFEIPPDGRVEVPIEVRGVEDLYAVDLEIRFDPAVILIEDANPDKPGVQPALGTFLDAGLMLFNEVDNEEGLVRFVMTQLNPSEGKSGDGIVLVLYVRGRAVGESELTLETAEMSTRAGEAIAVEAVDGSIVVAAEAEEKEATSIPVQDPTQAIDIPTLAPSPTATEGPDPTPTTEPTLAPTPAPTDEPTDEPTPGSQPEVEPTPDESTGAVSQVGEDTPEAEQTEPTPHLVEQGVDQFSLLQYWWAVLIVVAIAIGLAIYLLVTK